ncbi:hypothetical protein Q5752_004379 [Cryptotrichosporon argae]
MDMDESELSEHAILWKCVLALAAAWGALRRPQLVSLSKKYDLKASGKNTELVARLTEFGGTLIDHPSNARALAPTPQAERTIQPKPSRATLGRGSDAWELLSDANASLVVADDNEDRAIGSMRSWKSAGNGESLGDFGLRKSDSSKTVSSIRSLTRSIKRNSMSLLSNRSTSSHSIPMDTAEDAAPAAAPAAVEAVEASLEDAEMLDALPPSPASTVGVAKRHSTMSLHHRPSTIRLVSPTPSQLDPDVLPLANLKERRSMAPLRLSPGPARALDRRSMPALSSSMHAMSSPGVSRLYPPLPAFTMPVHFDQSSSPPPPDDAPTPTSTGEFPPLPPTPAPAFVFGHDTTSSAQFDDAAAKLMAELAAKTGVGFNAELLKGRHAEMGKLVAVNAEVGTGTDGWGLASKSAPADRYAEAHQREFVRMQSLSTLSGPSRHTSTSTLAPKRKLDASVATCPSAPNGAPLIPPADEGRTAKRTKMSVGASSIARSIMGTIATPRRKTNLRPEGSGVSPSRPPPSDPVIRHKQLTAAKRGLLRRMSPTKAKEGKLAETVRRTQTAVRRASVDLSTAILGRPPTPSKTLDQTTRRDKARLPIPAFADGQAGVSAAPPAIADAAATPRPTLSSSKSSTLLAKSTSTLAAPTASSLSRSTASAQSSTLPLPRSRSSKAIPTRSQLPTSRTVSSASTASGLSGLSTASTISRSHELSTGVPRKVSRAEAISAARPAPAPPAASAARSPVPGLTPAGWLSPIARPSQAPVEQSRSAFDRKMPAPSLPRSASTLYAPTAASLARMQATARPARPLPRTPGATSVAPSAYTFARPAQASGSPAPAPGALPIANLYGAGASRDNLFATNFHLAPPAPLSPARQLPVPPLFLASDLTSAAGLKPAPWAPGHTPLKPAHSSDRVLSPRTPKSSKIPVRQASAQRVRARSGGLGTVKSKGDLKAAEMERRRAEIRARQGRIVQEREIREMLG